MANKNDPRPTCARCQQRFTKVSSLNRHAARCHRNLATPSRQKACRSCSVSKLRCDLQRPACGRCQARAAQCQYSHKTPDDRLRRRRHASSLAIPVSPTTRSAAARSPASRTADHGSASTTTTPPIAVTVASEAVIYARTFISSSSTTTTTAQLQDLTPPSPRLLISEARKQALLGQPGTPTTAILARHTVSFVTRVLLSWPRMLALRSSSSTTTTTTLPLLPPMMHETQFSTTTPLGAPLANCCALVRMWAGEREEEGGGSRELVRGTVLEEVTRLLREHPTYTTDDLLSTAQSLLLLLTILFFGLDPPSSSLPPSASSRSQRHLEAQLLIQTWDVRHRLASHGLFLPEEQQQQQQSSSPIMLPPTAWPAWIAVSTRRRTLLSLSHLEWAWSLTHGYPTLSCFELAPLPAPAASYLWRAGDAASWATRYGEWAWRWRGPKGGYRMREFFEVQPVGRLDSRGEMWLAEADEFGMLLMAEVVVVNAMGGGTT